MNTYNLKLINHENKRQDQFILSVTIEMVQNAAHLFIGRKLTPVELGYFELLLKEKLNTVVFGGGSLFSRVIMEAVLFKALEEVKFGNSPADLIV